jgi:hypothetical protein
VRAIFARYLELGSVRALAEDLDRRGIRSKSRQLATGRTIGGGRFGVGALAHLLKNRFYLGEVVYRGEVHRCDHTPILDPALFAAVQEKFAAQAVERRCRLRGASALLAGRLFDERSNRMIRCQPVPNFPDFVPWRFSAAGCVSAWKVSHRRRLNLHRFDSCSAAICQIIRSLAGDSRRSGGNCSPGLFAG